MRERLRVCGKHRSAYESGKRGFLLDSKPRKRHSGEPMREVILTDETGADLGTMEIVAAHSGEGKMHKAFSIFIFTPDGKKLFIQKRSEKKMLWPLKWANSCCSHPRREQETVERAQERLMEECGFTCPLSVCGTFSYRKEDPDGRGTEHEFDTLLIGTAEETTDVNPNPDEVADYKWIELDELERDFKDHPEIYAYWFPHALAVVQKNR